jgi:hypothetical protein
MVPRPVIPTRQTVPWAQHTTWRWAFLGLSLALVGAGVTAWDVRHPHTQSYNCVIQAVGTRDNTPLASAKVLYDQHFDAQHNVIFGCDVLGRVAVNDRQAPEMAHSVGRRVQLRFRQYQFLPDQWRLR